MDKRRKLYNLYKERGLISDAVSEDVFLSANELQQEQLYNLGKQYDLFESTDFGTFQSAWEPIKKKEDSGLPSDQEDTSLATQEMEGQEPSVSSQEPKVDFTTQVSSFAEAVPSADLTKPAPKEDKRTSEQVIQDVIKDSTEEKKQEKLTEEQEQSFFDKANVNPNDLILEGSGIVVDRTTENFERISEKANALQEMYGDLGFLFEANESRYIGDDITVTSDDGTQMSFNLSGEGSKAQEQSEKLQKFLFSKSGGREKRDFTEKEMLVYSNRSDYENISKSKYDRIFTNENISKAVSHINESIKSEQKGINESKKELADIYAMYQEADSEEAKLSIRRDYELKLEELDSKIKDYNMKVNLNNQSIDNIMSERFRREKDKGNWASATYNGFVKGSEDLAKGMVYLLFEGSDMLTPGLLDDKDKVASEKMLNEYIEKLSEGLQARGVTQAYLDSQNMAMKALFSVPEFIPALLVPGGTILKGGRLAALGMRGRSLALTAQGIGRRMSEYDASPEMQKTMSREEAFLLNAVKARVEAALEEVGFLNATARSGLANSLVVKGLQKWLPETGTRGLSKLLNMETKSVIAKIGLNTAGAFAAEFETGALQNIMETSINEIYNIAKEKEVFKQPKVFTEQWFKDLAYDATMEGLGGMWMGGIGNIARYTAEGVVSKRLNDEEFKVMKEILRDPSNLEAFETKLLAQVANKEITKEEAQAQIASTYNALSIIEQLPEGDLSEGQQRVAFDLINERQKLEQEIKGKDPNLVLNKTKRIGEINERLQKISENAVQEQSTDEVPVQPDATVSEEVEERVPETEPEVVTEEISEEEVAYTPPETKEQRMQEHDLFDVSTRQKAKNVGLEYIPGERWVLVNKVTGRLAYTPTKKQALAEIENMSYDYGKGDMVNKKEMESVRGVQEVSEQAAIEEAVIEEEARPIEERKPRIQAIEEEAAKVRKTASKKTFTAKQATQLKKELRDFINKTLPKAMWTTPEVKKILREVQNATIRKNYYKLVEKPKDDIREVMSRVIDLVNEKSSKISMAEVKNLMDVKTEKKEGGRMKGRFTAEGVDRINNFKEDMSLNEKSPLDEVDGKIDKLNEEKEALENKIDLTEEDLKRLEMINIALLYNSALNMDNKSQAKSKTLEEVARNIKIVLSGEKTEFKDAQEAKHERYIQEQQDALESITGLKVNLKDPESVKQFERELEAIEEKEQKKKGIRRFLSRAAKMLDNAFILRVEAMEGLLDRITKESAEMFGGKLSTLIKDRVDESARNYKKNKKETLDKIEEKAKEIYGQNWESEMKKNSKETVEIYKDSKRVEELKKELENTTDLKKRRKIVEEIEKLTFPAFSQNQMYYHYNQYKDPSNHPSYETKWDNPSDVMKQIEEKLDPKVKEWADWQVNEFFPSVYEQYNEVYRAIYNTNMPWNEFYAGRIFREGTEDLDVDLTGLSSKKFQNSLTNASTKARVKNKQKIRDMDGNNALLSYVSDMEYFRSYAENMRDISKIFSQKDGLVKKAITATTNKDTYDVLFSQDASKPGMLAKIMNRGFNMRGSENQVMDTMTRNFVVSRLGLNPTIFLKQMTSALAFADYIGYRNWTKYGLKELTNGVAGFNSTWKELYDNSVELQNRYDTKDFTKVLESYSKEDQDILSGNVSMSKFMDFMMYLVKQGDKGGVMGSIPNYSYYKDQYKKKNPKATNQEVIDYAVKKVEQEVKSTQQDQDIQNKDFYQTGNWYQRWLSMFQSSSRALLRKEIMATRNLYRKLSKWDKEAGTGTRRQNIRMFMTYHVVLPMFFQYIALGLPGLLTDMDKEDKEALGMAAILGNLNSLFVIGQIFNTAIDYIKKNPWAGDATDLPVLELANGIFEDINRLNEAKKEATKQKYRMKLLGSILDLGGIPGSQANKLYQNYKALTENDFKTADDYKDATARLLGYSDYQIKPPKRRGGKKIKRKKVVTPFD
jgi:hypothetical protein